MLVMPPVIALAAMTSACVSKTTLDFRSPEGTVLEFERNMLNGPRRITFRSLQEFRQTHRPREDGTPLTGTIRVDKALLTSNLPIDAEKYLIKDPTDPNIQSIKVKGYYWIFKYREKELDELTAQYVDIEPKHISALLAGQAVTIEGFSVDKDPVFRLSLGIVLPEGSGS